MTHGLQIGELARKAQCPAETIRFYERQGLLPAPRRSAGNYRLFAAEHLERLAFIRNCRSLDMTLDEIRHLQQIRDAAQDNCSAAHAVLDEHIEHVGARILELRQLQRQLRTLRQQCVATRDEKDCAILDELGKAADGNSARHHAHVRGTHHSR